jgi:hypothetical protein
MDITSRAGIARCALRRPAGVARGPLRATALTCAVLMSGAALLLAGCSGGSAGGAFSAGSAATGASNGGHGPAAAPGAAAPSTPGPGTAPSSVAQASTLALASQSIVYTASLTVETSGVAAAAARATGIVIAAGGYVSAEQASLRPNGHALPKVSLQLKIPVAVYQPTLSRLATGLGTQTSLTEHAQDVTQQVADVTSLVSSAQAAITQLQALLQRAGTVSDLLTVQDQINAQESSLEALQAQQLALSRETSYATVSVTLLSRSHRVARVRRVARRRHGFVGGLAAGWRALRAAASAVLTGVGAVLPFAVIAAAAAAAGYAGRRRLGRLVRRGSGPTAAG